MNASLNKKLGNVKWGDYKMGELFQRVKTNKLPYKADELPNQPLGEYTLPCLTSSFNNQGLITMHLERVQRFSKMLYQFLQIAMFTEPITSRTILQSCQMLMP